MFNVAWKFMCLGSQILIKKVMLESNIGFGKKIMGGFALLLLVFFTACQEESATEQHSTKESITKTTPLTTFVKRIVMQKTTQDDLIDDSEYSMLLFPYTITVNNVEITLNSTNDYQLVKNNIDAYYNDSDTVSIHFPVTALMEDYTQRSLSYPYDLNNLIAECETKNTDLGKINCINMAYPIVINSYNGNNSIASSTSISSNQSLYVFLDNLEENQFIAISYPISITNSNGEMVQVLTNDQFENQIKEALDTCPENANPTLDFEQTLISSGSWKISYFYDDGEKTSLYYGYNFSFNSNHTVSITKSGVAYNGSWTSSLHNGLREFKIDINSGLLDELDEEWNVFEFNDSHLRFRDTSEGNLETDYLYFQKN